MLSELILIEQIFCESVVEFVYFYVNDLNCCGLGMGEIDFRLILVIFKEIDYDGWVSVEVFDYEFGVERFVIESIVNFCDCFFE